MTETLTNTVPTIRRGAMALLRIVDPPVNALSLEVAAGLAAALDAFEAYRCSAALRRPHLSGRRRCSRWPERFRTRTIQSMNSQEILPCPT